MNEDALRLRPARPDLDEGVVFARFVDEIAEGGFRIMLGRRVVEILSHAFMEPGHGMSYQNTLFAERHGEIVGMVSGYVAGGGNEGEDEALRVAPGNRLRRRLAVLMMRLRWRMIGLPPPGEFYVEFLIVKAGLRSQGIGGVLLDAMEEQARAAGVARLTLDVAAKNSGGRRFYERRGMTRVPDWPTSRFRARPCRRRRRGRG